MRKFCGDNQCRRIGERLSADEFPRDRKAKDGRYVYCKECCRRRSRKQRADRGAREYPKCKPMVFAWRHDPFAFSKVYDAILAGARTRQEIHKATELDYDSIGEALCELVFEAGAVRIINRELIPIGVEDKKAA